MASESYIDMRRTFRSDFPELMKLFNEYWANNLDFITLKAISQKWINLIIDTPDNIQNNRFYHVMKFHQHLGPNSIVDVCIPI